MFLIPGSVRVFVAREPIDMRKSFEGLSNQVQHVLGRDPLSGDIHVFLNRRRTLMKMLVWTRGGMTIVYKRLERGQYAFPSRVAAGDESVEIDMREMSMLLKASTYGTVVCTSDGSRRGRARRWRDGAFGAARTKQAPRAFDACIDRNCG